MSHTYDLKQNTETAVRIATFVMRQVETKGSCILDAQSTIMLALEVLHAQPVHESVVVVHPEPETPPRQWAVVSVDELLPTATDMAALNTLLMRTYQFQESNIYAVVETLMRIFGVEQRFRDDSTDERWIQQAPGRTQVEWTP